LEYETFKRDVDEETEEVDKKIVKSEYLLNQRTNENSAKLDLYKTTKIQSEANLENLNLKLNEVKNKKNNLEEENCKIKEATENMEKEYIIKIEKINNVIEENKKKEKEYNTNTKGLMEEIIKLDKIINQKKSEGAK